MKEDQEKIVDWIARTGLKMTATLIPARTDGVNLDDGQHKVTRFHYRIEFSWPDGKKTFILEFSSGWGCFGSLPRHVKAEKVMAKDGLAGQGFWDLSAVERIQIKKYREAVQKGPSPETVLDCLLADSDVLDYSFSEWCENLGGNSDSIKEKASYDFCLELAHKFKRFCGAHYQSLLTCERL